MRIATIYKNGVEIDGGSSFRLMESYFAHPVEESDMFHAGMMQLKDAHKFEFVKDNDVYLITLTEIDKWLLEGN